MKFPALVRRRSVPVPTVAGWLAILAALAGTLRLAAPAAYRFLACGPSAPGRYLAVEGWVPDHAAPAVVDLIRTGGFERVFTTGGPLEHGTFLSPWKDWATVAAAGLAAAGAPSNAIAAVPAPGVRKDRTLASALALRDRLRASALPPGKVTLVTMAPHARRSRLLFRRALGSDWPVDTWTYDPDLFDASDWWRSSEGFKTVVYEHFACLYSLVAGGRPTD